MRRSESALSTQQPSDRQVARYLIILQCGAGLIKLCQIPITPTHAHKWETSEENTFYPYAYPPTLTSYNLLVKRTTNAKQYKQANCSKLTSYQSNEMQAFQREKGMQYSIPKLQYCKLGTYWYRGTLRIEWHV